MSGNKKVLKTKIGLITLIVSVIHVVISFCMYYEAEAIVPKTSDHAVGLLYLVPIFFFLPGCPNLITLFLISCGYFTGKELFFYIARIIIFFLMVLAFIFIPAFMSIGDGFKLYLIGTLAICLPIIQLILCNFTYKEMIKKRKELNNNKK